MTPTGAGVAAPGAEDKDVVVLGLVVVVPADESQQQDLQVAEQ